MVSVNWLNRKGVAERQPDGNVEQVSPFNT